MPGQVWAPQPNYSAKAFLPAGVICTQTTIFSRPAIRVTLGSKVASFARMSTSIWFWLIPWASRNASVHPVGWRTSNLSVGDVHC
jgi:hypothetical protein